MGNPTQPSPGLTPGVRFDSVPRVAVGLTRSAVSTSPALLVDVVIKGTTEALSFRSYQAFMDWVLCREDDKLRGLFATDADLNAYKNASDDRYGGLAVRRFLPYTDTDAYRLLKAATEAFLEVNCGIQTDLADLTQRGFGVLPDGILAPDLATTMDWWRQFYEAGSVLTPYLAAIRSKFLDLPLKTRFFWDGLNQDERTRLERCYGILREKLMNPCMIELIWSYWHEQGMLAQTLSVVSRRFQNIRGPSERDPLAMMEIDPLRPLNNLLWGYIQDEQHRLSIVRRAYEYDHHYGLTLEGKAVPEVRGADSRSRFLEAFHNLLHLCSIFYKQSDDTTVIPDGFPVLNALKDVHMLLSEGAHNQFGDLPVTARAEMLMQQWLLARPEFREALPSRVMVAYPEAWMERVDVMKRLQGWPDASALHFRNLGVFGEQLLLSARFRAWNEINDPQDAAAWAMFWRPQAQGYMHAYRAVTGVDLAADVSEPQQRELMVKQPSALMRQRLQSGTTTPLLTTSPQTSVPATFRERRAIRK